MLKASQEHHKPRGPLMLGDELHWTARDEAIRKQRKELDTDTALWLTTPWQSAHDGCCPSPSLAFKWNEQRARDKVGQDGRPVIPRRNRQTFCGNSTSRADFVPHKGRYWHTNGDLTPLPSESVWDDDPRRLAQPHQTRHYRRDRKFGKAVEQARFVL